MEKQQAPNGWSFYSADFSLQAHDKSKYGGVMFIRDTEQRKLWHSLPDEIKEADDYPPLYVRGTGSTIDKAIQDAITKIAHIDFLLKSDTENLTKETK